MYNYNYTCGLDNKLKQKQLFNNYKKIILVSIGVITKKKKGIVTKAQRQDSIKVYTP